MRLVNEWRILGRLMDERKADHIKLAPPSLKAAVRRARVEAAEQSEAVDDLRQAELMRLELLQEAIRPVVDQAPEGVDLFDVGIAHGERPRLFLDMIGFVEMGHDRRAYRFYQDTRHGRVLIAESANIDRIVAAMTNYIARRLVEREKALASDGRRPAKDEQVRIGAKARALKPGTEKLAAPAKRTMGQVIWEAFVFLLLTLGAFTMFALLALGGWVVWSDWGRALWTARFGSAPF
jgi:hypothetical protein